MLSIFDKNSRIEKISNGIKFYEQDILSCSYIFENDIIIDLNIDYITSGFGIVIIEDYYNNLNLINTDIAYLIKIGSNDYSVIEKNFLIQKQIQNTTCLLAPSNNNKNISLKFTYADNIVSFDWIFDQNTTYNLGKTTLTKKIGRYRIGFYSNKDNVIHNISIKQGVAKNWNTSIKNTRGGRISFFDNGFKFENCEYDAEIEQQNIKLSKGTYYLDFESENINNEFNIDCSVFPSQILDDTKEKFFEDDTKNLLNKTNNTINITEDMSVNLKFKGTNGKISNICIKDDPDSEYVETTDEVVHIEGSYMTVFLSKLKKIRWRGTINTVPLYTDLTKPCPYAIIETLSNKTTIEELNLKLKQEYGYIYDVESNILSITDTDYNKIYKQITLNLTEDDHKKINVFRNINAYIYELIVTRLDGEETNILTQKTFKKYIVADINSPIIVTKEDKKTVLDLSSSYRQISSDEKVLKLYSTAYILLPKDAPFFNLSNFKIYAIPENAIIDMSKNKIEECASLYIELNRKDYNINNSNIILTDEIKNNYPNIIIEYISTSISTNIFTNYEREVFDASTTNLVLEKEPLQTSNNIIIYGILKDSEIKEDNLYRVPKTIINSIDYYANKFDVLLANEYSIDYDNNEIKLNTTILDKYKQFIVDYLKNDSYAINYIEEHNQYEVDISTNEDMLYLNYNMREDGSIYDYKITEIIPDKDKYIVLRKES